MKLLQSASCCRSHCWNSNSLLIKTIVVPTSAFLQKQCFNNIFSPGSMVKSKWCLSSLNHPGMSTLHPYRPASESVRFSIVRETFPSSSLPSNWYLLEALVPSFTLRPSVAMSWLLQPDDGMSPRPQQTASALLYLKSYIHNRVTFWPVWPTTLLLWHSLTVETEKTSKLASVFVSKNLKCACYWNYPNCKIDLSPVSNCFVSKLCFF